MIEKGQSSSDRARCPYLDEDCPKLLNYIKNHEKMHEEMKKDIDFIKKAVIFLAVILVGSDAFALVIP